ncbi:MAG: DUF7220 family protein [Nitrospira sp.]
MLEAVLNTASGMILSFVTAWLIYPLYGFHPSVAENVSIVAIFTVISVLRSYVWRRLFNWFHHGRPTCKPASAPILTVVSTDAKSSDSSNSSSTIRNLGPYRPR